MANSSYKKEYDIKKTCRACLKVANMMNTLLNGYLHDMFTKFTNLEITENDGLPFKLCSNCVDKLNSCSLFLKLCIESDSILKQQKVKHENEENKSVLVNANDIDVLHAATNNLLDVCIQENENKTNVDFIKDESDFDNEDYVEIDTVFIEEENHFTADSKIEANTKKEQIKVSPIQRTAVERKCKPTEIETSNSKLSDYNLYLSCPKCGQNFSKPDRLEAHYRVHFGKKPEVCKLCKRGFVKPERLKKHMLKHSEKDLQCSVCGENFDSKTILRNHKKTHAENRTFVCHICGKSFGKNYHLTAHTAVTHSDERPYSCSICPTACKTANTLKMHLLRHEGIKKYICATCGYGCFKKSNLKRHLASHSDDKPFACKLCPKKYKTYGHLADHNKIHTGNRPYKCDLCPMSFRTKLVLKHHRMTHTGEKPNICSICGKGFAQRTALLTHSKVHRD